MTGLAIITVALAAIIALALTLSASAQSEPWQAAVTGVSVVAGDNPGELVVSWDAHPENPNDYRVKWAEEDGEFRPYGNSNWNAYPTGTTHTVAGLTPGATYKATVLARFDDRKRSDWSEVVTGSAAASSPNVSAAGQPSIVGTAQVGETLTAGTDDISDDDGLEDVTFTYQWIRVNNGTDTDITDATSSSYTLTSDDAGKQVRVRVSFTDDEGNAEQVTSDAWPSEGSVVGVSTAVALSLSAGSVAEDASATAITVTGTLNGAARTNDTTMTVEVGASGDAATEGTDYATVADLTLTIDAGETTGTASFTLTPTDDDVAEGDETL